MWMMMHECRGGIHKRVIEDLMLHQPVHRPHDASHMFVTVFLLTILRQRIQAQQVETETVRYNHLAAHQLALMVTIVVTIERIVAA